jgi:MYXO-CTERM domain-containing protein
MVTQRVRFNALLIAAAFAACSDVGLQQASGDQVAVVSAALDACSAAPAATLDGFPAYAQCAASTFGPIYSNDGINTSTTSQGPDWILTQGSGGYQCTELVTRYFHFKWKVPVAPWGGLINGNASAWCDGVMPAGVVKTNTPVHGDAIVLAPGSCFASAATGHIALVDQVTGDLMTSVEQNSARAGLFMKSCALCYLHAVANTGTDTGSGGSGTGGNGAGGMPGGAAGQPAQGAAGGQPVATGAGGRAGPTGPGSMPVTVPMMTQPPTGLANIGSAGAGAQPQAAAAVSPPITVPALPQSRNRGDASASCSVHADGKTSAGAWLLLSIAAALMQRRRHAALRMR